MKQKLYIETSVVSYLAARPSRDLLVTWNFAHLNNPIARLRIRRIIEDNGYRCPEVCLPEELPETDV